MLISVALYIGLAAVFGDSRSIEIKVRFLPKGAVEKGNASR